MAFFKGKVVTAGGKGNGNTKTDIHTFTPSEGWIKAADLPWSRFSSDALVLDEGTSQVSQEFNGKQEIHNETDLCTSGSFINLWWKEWRRYNY